MGTRRVSLRRGGTSVEVEEIERKLIKEEEVEKDPMDKTRVKYSWLVSK